MPPILVTVAALLLAGQSAGSAAGMTDGPEDVAALAREVLADGRYQRELPGHDHETGTRSTDARPAEGPRRRRSEGDWRQVERTSAPPPSRSSGAFGPVFEVLAWGALLLALGVGLAMLVRSLVEGRRAQRPVADAEADDVNPPPFRPTAAPLDDADRLAADGRYGEALHVMLLRLLDALARHEGRAPVPSMTSREIVAGASVPEAQRDAIGVVVAAVELSLFGGQEPDAAAWETCADHYRAMMEAWS